MAVSNSLSDLPALAPSVELLDSYQHFCDEESCSMILGNELFYWDQDHLNSDGSRYLLKRLTENSDALTTSLVAN